MTRTRKTRSQMIELRRAQLAKLEAQEEGTYSDNSENGILKQLKARRRKCNTTLKGARNLLRGVRKADGTGWARSPISEKIELAETRLENHKESEERANVFDVKLPFDIERLDALIQTAEAGAIVDFPTDLTRLGRDEDRTDDEHEAMELVSQSDGNEED